MHVTNPLNSGFDYDELTKYWEWLNGTNPWINDTDTCGLLDGKEYLNCSY